MAPARVITQRLLTLRTFNVKVPYTLNVRKKSTFDSLTLGNVK
jgi:hypothetical protein